MVQTGSESYISLSDFWRSLLDLQTERFSGTLELNNPASSNWKMYFYLGRLLYATGGKHPVRRWIRQVKEQLPQISLKEDNLYNQEKEYKICWEYEVLSSWYLEGKIEREKVIKIIYGVIKEVFFDIHAVRISRPSIQPEEGSFLQQWTFVPLQQYIVKSNQEWKSWQERGIADIEPAKRPSIVKNQELAARLPPKAYQNMVQLFDSQLTLWELSAKIKKPVFDLTVSILPYLRLGMIEMVETEDWPSPERKSPGQKIQVEQKLAPLIACVDDSTAVTKTIGKLIEKAGWRFLEIHDPLRAIPILIAKRPDIVLLDLKMPVTNGYELCEIIRKLSVFKKTPIIILTGQDGLVDRMRAKMVGATGFVSKLADPEKLLEVISRCISV